MLEFIVGTMIFVIIVTVCLGVFSKKIAAKSKGGQYLRSALKGNMALMASLVLVAALFLFSGAAIHSNAADTSATAETQSEQSNSSAGRLGVSCRRPFNWSCNNRCWYCRCCCGVCSTGSHQRGFKTSW